jgi:anti-sigma factor RsiW
MQCRDVRELADSFLSEQLLVETNHELLRHLETCPDCRADIAGRRAMRDGLRAAFSRAEELRPRAEFATELLATLRLSQPGIAISQPAVEISRRSVLQSWWALAAGLVLAAGGGLVVRHSNHRSRLGALAREAAGDHQNCAVKFRLAERPIQLEEAGRRYGAPYAALATFEPPAVDGSLDMLERHSCVYQGRRYGHVVFRYRGALTSLLVTEGTPPATPELEPSDSGPAVASLPAGRFLGFVVADLDQPSVLRLAQTLAEPLSRHLA